MSIVYDYLKQIKDKKETASAAPSQVSKPTPRSFVWIKVLAVMALCAGIGIAVYVHGARAVKPIVNLYHTPEADVSDLPMLRSQGDALVLEGIIYNPSQPFAIINGKMLETKGRVGSYEVVKITPDAVMLRNTQDGTAHTLQL